MGDILPYIFGVVIVGVGLMLLLVINRTQTARPLDIDWYEAEWRAVSAQAQESASGRQLAILNADKLLDKAMRERNFKGKSMGERLKLQPKKFKDVSAIWSAHKLRNRVAHESNAAPETKETDRALAALRAGLRDLGALR